MAARFVRESATSKIVFAKTRLHLALYLDYY
jgi:hypothetical protein